MKIAVIGAGALGSLFGGLLAKSGQEVWLYNRSSVEHIHAIRTRGLTLYSEAGEEGISITATSKIEEIPSPMDLLGIFVKAHDTEQAIRDARPLVCQSSWVLSLQNGVGPEETLSQYVPRSGLLRGVTAQGATLEEPGVVRWAGRGPTRFGPLAPADAATQKKIHAILDVFNRAGIEAYYAANVQELIWEKLLINAAINPLTALFDVPNGALLQDPNLRSILRAVLQETLPIITTHGVNLSLPEAIQLVEGICERTAQNLSSMLQDVRHGKRTEIDFINGVVLREGERLGIPTPLHRLLIELIITMRRLRVPPGSGGPQGV